MSLVRLRGTFTEVIRDVPMMELSLMAMCMLVLSPPSIPPPKLIPSLTPTSQHRRPHQHHQPPQRPIPHPPLF